VELRPILTPKPLSEQDKRALVELLRRIEEALESGAEEAASAIDEFNEKTERDYRPEHFFEYWEAMSAEEFVEAAYFKSPGRVADITREELIEVVRRAMKVIAHQSFYMELFDDNVPRPAASNLIFYPPDDQQDVGTWDPTPEEIVDLALSYEAIALPG